jgi:HK97 family phage major capsid protein
LLQRVHEIQEQADNEDRELTDQERSTAEKLLERAKEAKHLQDKLAEIDGGESWGRGIDGAIFGQGLGDQFVQSEGYKAIRDPASRPQTWSSGAVELETKGTLVTTPGTGLTPAGYVPGVVETLFQRLYLADLMPNREAPGNPVRHVSETTATNAAAAVAETGVKPESTLVFGEVSEPVRKIATLLPISDEMLEDAPQIQAYLNSRLTLFVKQQEEQQLLLGSGTAPNLQGFVASGRAIGTYARGTADDNALAIFKAANGTRGSSFLDPDTVVIHPTNWQAIRTAKDDSGQYYGGGPFYGPYGGPQGPAGASQFSADSLWGMRVVVTSAITVGTALVGAFGEGAAVFRKGGVTVEASNSHSTYFASDITTLRAELRLALGVFRPSAFVAVTQLA